MQPEVKALDMSIATTSISEGSPSCSMSHSENLLNVSESLPGQTNIVSLVSRSTN